jgi:chorismate dehydratase
VPWVSAVWAVRPEAIEAAKLSAQQVTEDFLGSRDHGMAHVEDLVQEWTLRIAVPAVTIRSYLTEHIHYVLDEACLAGMDLFFRYAAEAGVLPQAPPLRWLE